MCDTLCSVADGNVCEVSRDTYTLFVGCKEGGRAVSWFSVVTPHSSFVNPSVVIYAGGHVVIR